MRQRCKSCSNWSMANGSWCRPCWKARRRTNKPVKVAAVKRPHGKPKKKPKPGKGFRGTYYEYLRSPQWAKKRKKAFKHYGRACTCCGATNEPQVHHRHYKTLFREGVLDLDVLCGGCHANEHEREGKDVADPMTKAFLVAAANL